MGCWRFEHKTELDEDRRSMDYETLEETSQIKSLKLVPKQPQSKKAASPISSHDVIQYKQCHVRSACVAGVRSAYWLVVAFYPSCRTASSINVGDYISPTQL